MEVQDLGLARQQIVTDREAVHGVENAFDVSAGDIIGQFGGRVIAFLDKVEDLGAFRL
jgi:hypothetical protein